MTEADLSLPQRGDVLLDATREENLGYQSVAEGVRGGLLQLIPLEETCFCQEHWCDVDHPTLTRMSDSRRSNCQRIPTQLRSGIGITPGVAPLYGDRSIKLEDGRGFCRTTTEGSPMDSALSQLH